MGKEWPFLRVTYSLAGQVIAVWVTGDPVAANNGLFYLHSDHLGSTSAMSNSSGQLVGGVTRYYPFGAYRSGGPNAITDKGFTGQKENMELGLYYYNARYYVSGIGRFASADTIVPDPANPQSWNRYSYVSNNPIILVDPSGHCWGFASGLRSTFYSTTCNNLDMAWSIVTSPDATVLQKAGASAYMAVEATAHATALAGTAIIGAETAPAIITTVQTAAAAHTTSTAVVEGVVETAVECSMTGGGCSVADYVAGGATAGVAHRLSQPGKGYQREFISVDNESGGTVRLSQGPINQNDFRDIVENADGPVHILSGVHGDSAGGIQPHRRFYTSDVNRWGDRSNVTVYDINNMTHEEKISVINGPGTIICAWCYSSSSRTVNWHLRPIDTE